MFFQRLYSVSETILTGSSRKFIKFVKNRYSKNRQTAHTVVYFALYINIVIMYGTTLIFYKVLFNFGAYWWFWAGFLTLFLFSIFF